MFIKRYQKLSALNKPSLYNEAFKSSGFDNEVSSIKYPYGSFHHVLKMQSNNKSMQFYTNLDLNNL